MASADRIAAFVEDLKSRNVRYVRFELPDLHGTSRAKVVPDRQGREPMPARA